MCTDWLWETHVVMGAVVLAYRRVLMKGCLNEHRDAGSERVTVCSVAVKAYVVRAVAYKLYGAFVGAYRSV